MSERCKTCEMAPPDAPGGFDGVKEGTLVTAFGMRIVTASRARCGHSEIVCVSYFDEYQQWYRLIIDRNGLTTKYRKMLAKIPLNTLAEFEESMDFAIDVVGTLAGSDDAPTGFEKCGKTMVLKDARILPC